MLLTVAIHLKTHVLRSENRIHTLFGFFMLKIVDFYRFICFCNVFHCLYARVHSPVHNTHHLNIMCYSRWWSFFRYLFFFIPLTSYCRSLFVSLKIFLLFVDLMVFSLAYSSLRFKNWIMFGFHESFSSEAGCFWYGLMRSFLKIAYESENWSHIHIKTTICRCVSVIVCIFYVLATVKMWKNL